MICLLVCSSSPASFIWKVKQIRFMLYWRQTAVAPTKIEGVATAAFHANVDNCFFECTTRTEVSVVVDSDFNPQTPRQ